MTIAQIWAFLAVLNSFGVDSTTVAKIQDILIPPVVQVAPSATTTQPVQQAVPQNLGSTSTTTVTTTPVVQSPIMIPNWTIKVITEDGNTGKRDVAPTVKVDTGVLKLWVQVYDKDNKFQKVPVTLTTNDPDIKSPFVFNLPVEEAVKNGGNYVDFVSIAPKTVGTFDFTFTSGDATTTTQVTVIP